MNHETKDHTEKRLSWRRRPHVLSLILCGVTLLAGYLVKVYVAPHFWRLVLRYLIGYAVAVFVGHGLIKLVVDEWWEKAYPNEHRKSTWQSAVVGFVERALFVACLSTGHAGFIAVWLGLKLMGSWKFLTKESGKSQSEDAKSGEHGKKQGASSDGSDRVDLNLLLVGSGLSLAYAVLGAYSIRWLSAGYWWVVFLLTLSLVGATLALYYYIRRAAKRTRHTEPVGPNRP